LSPAENAWDAWERLTLEPLHANDPRYLDCSAARGIDVVQKLQIELRLHSRANKCMHQLFTGYRGDGKTTELYRFIGLIENDYRPLYFNAEEVFDLNDFRFPDFLLGIATVVFERMNEQKLKLPNDLLEKVANWFAKIVEVVERKTSAELQAEAGISIPNWIPAWFKFVTGKLVGTIKTGGEKRKEVRTELNQSLPHLIHHVDELLSTATKVSKDFDNRELVIIFDNLDRLHPDLASDLFHTNGQNLCGLDCHFVYVVPISLLYRRQGTLLPFRSIPITMKMIPVRNSDGTPNEGNISHLTQVLKKRFVPDKIMTNPDEIMRDFILSSGGHLRDVIRLFRQACRDALGEHDEKINKNIAQRTINELCETYQKAVEEEDYKNLIESYRTKEVRNDERTQLLIYNTAILVYSDANGLEWYDVHPALANGKKFQKLLLC
jgi:hypothetical protein